jgi:hypothetical protein
MGQSSRHADSYLTYLRLSSKSNLFKISSICLDLSDSGSLNLICFTSSTNLRITRKIMNKNYQNKCLFISLYDQLLRSLLQFPPQTHELNQCTRPAIRYESTELDDSEGIFVKIY